MTGKERVLGAINRTPIDRVALPIFVLHYERKKKNIENFVISVMPVAAEKPERMESRMCIYVIPDL